MAIVRYLVNNIEVSIEFYVDILGFSLVEKMGPAFALVEKNDLQLWLSGPQTSAARPMPNGNVPQPGGWNRLVIQVDDIEALVSSMKEKGVRFRNEIISGPGGKQILAEDPSGNPIEIFQPV
ncbi:MAG: VOC family protein [Chloroflexi bacterium]|nr:VOC family protein [Chloroflexota bacterium]MBI3169612.1 VOC family protein [Chloroflexota bacterium]